MKNKLYLFVLTAFMFFSASCSVYQQSDYPPSEQPNLTKQGAACIHMEPAQAQMCQERERKLVISLNKNNCDSPYPYQKNHCENNKKKQKKLLAESLNKRLD